jgi:hypothetical protein
MRRLFLLFIFLLGTLSMAQANVIPDENKVNFAPPNEPINPTQEVVRKIYFTTNSEVKVYSFIIEDDKDGCFSLVASYPTDGSHLEANKKAVAVVKFSCSKNVNHSAKVCILTDAGKACTEVEGTVSVSDKIQ